MINKQSATCISKKRKFAWPKWEEKKLCSFRFLIVVRIWRWRWWSCRARVKKSEKQTIFLVCSLFIRAVNDTLAKEEKNKSNEDDGGRLTVVHKFFLLSNYFYSRLKWPKSEIPTVMVQKNIVRSFTNVRWSLRRMGGNENDAIECEEGGFWWWFSVDGCQHSSGDRRALWIVKISPSASTLILLNSKRTYDTKWNQSWERWKEIAAERRYELRAICRLPSTNDQQQDEERQANGAMRESRRTNRKICYRGK